jgi:hypothetical protein
MSVYTARIKICILKSLRNSADTVLSVARDPQEQMMIPSPQKMQSVLSLKHLILDMRLQWMFKSRRMTLFLVIPMDCMEAINGLTRIHCRDSLGPTLSIVP